ncbi:hypothetical protein [Stenotrophomonas rhizophila]
MSADIVGSTAFKQRSDLGINAWFSMVRSFYSDSQRFFEESWAQALRAHRASGSPLQLTTEAPKLWKTIGDEVLFTKEITHAHEALICLSVWIEVLRRVREMLKKTNSLELKASAWLADFPIRNREIFLRVRNSQPSSSVEKTVEELVPEETVTISGRTEDDSDWENDQLFIAFKRDDALISRDFIGQAIDTGFRVSTHATVRKLALSVELAHILSMTCAQIADGKLDIPMLGATGLRFYFDGRQALKGVMGGIPYPVIWLDAEPERAIHAAEDILMARPEPRAAQIHRFTSAMIGEFPDRFCTMLDFLGTRPLGYDAHEAKVGAAIEEMEGRFKRLEEDRETFEKGEEFKDQGTPSEPTDVHSLFAAVPAPNPVDPAVKSLFMPLPAELVTEVAGAAAPPSD